MSVKLNLLQIVNVRWFNASAEYAITISKDLAERGHKILIAGKNGTPPVEKANAFGLRVDTSLSFTPFSFFSDLLKLQKMVVSEDINIINSHRAEGHALAAALKIFNRRIKVVRTRVDIRSPKSNLFNKLIHRNTDKIIVPARFLKDKVIQSTGVQPDYVDVIYGGVDINFFKPGEDGLVFRKSLGLKPDDLLVGIVARLDPIKGHFVFLDTAKKLSAIFPEMKFIVVGTEAEYSIPYMKDYARKIGLNSNLFYTGYINNVNAAINSFDICLLTSLGSEAHSRVLLEYMACGKPVVASSVGVIPEILKHKIDGILVPAGDVDAFVEGITRIIKDKEFRCFLGRNAKEKVAKKFKMEDFIDNIEQSYRSIIDFN